MCAVKTIQSHCILKDKEIEVETFEQNTLYCYLLS